ncbi:DUF547 domain-containing protein [Maribacter hydrothermalis]|uniref:DUF547 domain-containing protein n=1 Tax=Maribacter hydrothermalis TaxID=1836467 RepID=A0A1B7ZBT6_9FLAO|nr:DUF547 domain-containing protein [Maribacter hydrothermalis]APQ15954.1 hypothetical protein BTR34_00740 [Maribacter hydrothermalis]OBR40371.1 hypothetical protein A9200_15945 [Maribacter hydrothermalis]
MKLKIPFLITILALLFIAITDVRAQVDTNKDTDFNELSETFLQRIIDKQDTQDLQNVLTNTSISELDNALDTNNKRLAFWLNIYNAYIQVILQKNPELYDDRGSFFKLEQIKIAGEMVSFAKIEHGLIRKSQWEYGLGYIRKWFPNKFERKLRVDNPIYNIHFALNCGAKDCPPVAIYEWERLPEQLQKGTKKHLKRTSDFNNDTNVVKVTSLFNWFRGDFGGKGGIKKILKENEIIPSTKGVDIEYTNYDWTLDLDNFIEL